MAMHTSKSIPIRVMVAAILLGSTFLNSLFSSLVPLLVPAFADMSLNGLHILGPIFLIRATIQVAALVAILQGRSWGRTLVVVLLVFTFLFFMNGALKLSLASWPAFIPPVLSMLLVAFALWLLYTGTSKAWFAGARPTEPKAD